MIRIAVSYKDGEIFEHFGHSEYFAIYEFDEHDLSVSTKRLVEASGLHGHQDMADLLKSENPDDKRLESELDAGWIKCATTGGNQSVVRKISGKRENGSIILQDTNNTTEDFTVSDSPQIRRDGAKRPGWSNWTTAQ